MKEYLKNLINNDIEFLGLINDLITNDTVLQMKNFRQHYIRRMHGKPKQIY